MHDASIGELNPKRLKPAEKGIITLQIGIQNVPVIMEEIGYVNLRVGALNNYWVFNLKDCNQYYYKIVYLGPE